MAIKQEIINRFDGGMIQDPRVKNTSFAQLINGFDGHTFPYKLAPLGDSASGDSSASTNKIQNFLIAPYGTDYLSDYRNFGLGVSGTKARVYVNSSLISSTWTSHTTASSHTTTDFELFIYYPKTQRIYGAADGTTIWVADPKTSPDAFDESDGNDQFAHTLTTAYKNPRNSGATNRPIISGLVHSKDDLMYIAYDNIIIRNNGTGDWTDPALTLPTNRVITSICEYGNYLAIGTKPLGDFGSSRVYLWDRDSSVTTLSESIDWGDGNLQVLEEVSGVLVGISSSSVNATSLLSKITFRYYAGGSPIVFRQFISEANYQLNDLKRVKHKVNNYLYFFLTLTLNDTKLEGLWKVGRSISTGQFAVTFDRPANNNTALTSGELHEFLYNGDILYIAYTDAGAVAMSLVGLTPTYTSANSIYESVILGDQFKTRKLLSAGIMTESLPSSGSVTLKYKKDGETAYTTIFTNTTTSAGSFVAGTKYTIITVGTTDFTAIGASANTVGLEFIATGVGTGNGKAAKDPVYHEAINIESSGAKLPQFREISFQVLSSGNAVITGIYCTYEEVNNNPSF